MLPFDSSSRPQRRPPPAYLSRGQQLRMLSLVLGLGLVLAAMNQLRQPAGVNTIDQLLHGANSSTPLADESPPVSPPVVSPELLATIDDNTYFRKAESEAWFAMLAYVRDANQQQLAATATGPLSYAQLARQPHTYRGRAVRVAGTARRIEPITPADNDLGIEKLYRVIIQGQGNEAWPTTVYSLTAPTEGRLTEAIELPVEVTGLFFKNWSYRYEGGLGLSPVVLTGSLTPIITAAATTTNPPELATWQIVAAAGVLATVILIVIGRRTPSATVPAVASSQLDFSELPGPETARGAND